MKKFVFFVEVNEGFLCRFCVRSRLAASINVIKQKRYTLNIIISSQNSYIFWNPNCYKFERWAIGDYGEL